MELHAQLGEKAALQWAVRVREPCIQRHEEEGRLVRLGCREARGEERAMEGEF